MILKGILGQNLSGVDPHHLQDFLIIGLAFVVTLATVLNLVNNMANAKRTKDIQRREVTFGDQIVTKEFCSAAHAHSLQRLEATEEQVKELWMSMRTEDEATRQEVRKCFQDIERALGRIEGELKTMRRENG